MIYFISRFILVSKPSIALYNFSLCLIVLIFFFFLSIYFRVLRLHAQQTRTRANRSSNTTLILLSYKSVRLSNEENAKSVEWSVGRRESEHRLSVLVVHTRHAEYVEVYAPHEISGRVLGLFQAVVKRLITNAMRSENRTSDR